ncbi:O-methyltransferase [Planomonospora algeriensis]
MSDFPVDVPPLVVKAQAIADRGSWRLSSEPRTGALLRTLAASKPGGRILEVGSGLGVGSGWLLAGMDQNARLIGLEIHEKVARISRDVLAADPRVEIIHADATEWLENYSGPPFDMVFVDTTITKFEKRETLYRHLADGALFVADDLLPGDTWTEDHPARVERFRKEIVAEPGLTATLIDWASGIVVATYRSGAQPG